MFHYFPPSGLTTREFKANVTRGTIHGLGDVLRRGDCSSVIVAGQQKVACNVSLSSVRILLDAEVKVNLIESLHQTPAMSTIELIHFRPSDSRTSDNSYGNGIVSDTHSESASIFQGDSIMAERHNISTTTVVDVNTRARVEVAGARWSFGTVSQVALYPVTMTSSVSQGKLDLNKSRCAIPRGSLSWSDAHFQCRRKSVYGRRRRGIDISERYFFFCRFEEFVQKLNAELAKHLFSTLQGPFFRAMNDFAKNCLLPF